MTLNINYGILMYDVPSSLKSATLVTRKGGKIPIYYKTADSTRISKLPMKKLLSHSNTKMELAHNHAAKSLEKGEQIRKR